MESHSSDEQPISGKSNPSSSLLIWKNLASKVSSSEVLVNQESPLGSPTKESPLESLINHKLVSASPVLDVLARTQSCSLLQRQECTKAHPMIGRSMVIGRISVSAAQAHQIDLQCKLQLPAKAPAFRRSYSIVVQNFQLYLPTRSDIKIQVQPTISFSEGSPKVIFNSVDLDSAVVNFGPVVILKFFRNRPLVRIKFNTNKNRGAR